MLTPPIMAPGFFGKVPARGDFVSRRVPPAVRAAWEAWLTNLTVAARAALGECWPDDWLTAPLWHFSLGSGISPPHGASGVLVASADRIGRLFPFTLIAAASGPPCADLGALNEWARAAEMLTMSALEDDFEPDALDAALVALGPPAALSGPAYATGHWRLAFDGDWPSDAGDNAGAAALHAPGAEQSAWYCRGAARVPPMHLRCIKLPSREMAAAMVTGGFDFRGCGN